MCVYSACVKFLNLQVFSHKLQCVQLSWPHAYQMWCCCLNPISKWLISWETQLIRKMQCPSFILCYIYTHIYTVYGWLLFLLAFSCSWSFKPHLYVVTSLPNTFFFVSWFFSSYHIHWSMERRISQTTPFTSYQIELILPPYQLSLSSCLYQQSLWWTESRSDQYIPLSHPIRLFLSWCYLCLNLCFLWVWCGVCMCVLLFCLLYVLYFFVWLSLSLQSRRWGSVKSCGKWPAC